MLPWNQITAEHAPRRVEQFNPFFYPCFYYIHHIPFFLENLFLYALNPKDVIVYRKHSEGEDVSWNND